MLGVVKLSVPVPPESTDPPDEPAYQSNVAPVDAVPDRLTAPVPERAPSVVAVTVGRALTVEMPVATLTSEAPVELSNTCNTPAELASDLSRMYIVVEAIVAPLGVIETLEVKIPPEVRETS